jgi:hypothetical protein
MNSIRPLLVLLGVAVVCVLLGSSARMGQDMRQLRLPDLFGNGGATDAVGGHGDGVDGEANTTAAKEPSTTHWFSIDPDGLYHTRRVERIFEEGYPAAAEDHLLNFPHGAPIPWPPYYEVLCHRLLSPFAPSEPQQRRIFLEQWMARLPFFFGLLSIALLVWTAGRSTLSDPPRVGSNQSFTTPARGLLAGLMLALSYGAAHYSPLGVGDHHAWVSLLTLLMFVLISAGMRDEVLDRPSRAGIYGLTAGVVGGVLLGTWVASLMFILMVQLAFGVLLLRQRNHARAGLAAMGSGFHVAALAVVLPAVYQSPWLEEFPWMVVNLSWFHPLQLALGALVFLPIHRNANGGKLHPLALPISILVAILLVTAAGIGPGAGIREGMSWVSRADEFMSGIAESEPLMNAEAWTWIGLGLLLLPFAWLQMLRSAWQKRQAQHWVWVMAVPLLLLQALTQRRFSEALAAPMAWVIAWAVFEWLRPWVGAGAKHAARASARQMATGFTAAIAIGFAANALTVPTMASPFGAEREAEPLHSAYREVYEWIGDQPLLDVQESVLATWDQGHSIEWLTGRGSVATNFGTYVGEDSYRDPSRFFLGNDFAAAEQILQQRKTRYVVRTSQLPLAMDAISRALQNDEVFVESFTNKKGQKRDRLTRRWFQSMAAILWMPLPPSDPQNPVVGLGMGDPDGPSRSKPPVDFMRLVHLSPVPDGDPRHGGMTYPAAAVWEYVPGARVQTQLQNGELLVVDIKATMTFGEQSLLSFQYLSTAAPSADGIAELRIPYATEANANGGSLFIHEAEYRVETADGSAIRSGSLGIAEAAVLQGNTITL